MENYINGYIRECIQGDGGQITFASRDGDTVTVIFEGECSKCLILDRCIAWIEQRILEDRGEKVTVKGIRKRPWFQDR